jgi:ABC-type glycerol-3-phosphate transport system substrate-binding protein
MLVVSFTACTNSEQAVYSAKMNEIQPSSQSGTPNSQTEQKTNKEALSGKLTVNSFWDFDMPTRIAEFTRINPNVEIEWNGASLDSQYGETKADYSQRMATELMSGKASDIVDLSGLSVYKYAKSGLLANYYNLMESDPSFHIEDYYDNIFKAMEYSGGLYAMPFTFNYDNIYFNEPLMEEMGVVTADYKTIDYHQMLGLYSQALQNGNIEQPFDLFSGIEKNSFWGYEFYSFYDPEKRTASFDSPEFIEYLEKTSETVDGAFPFGRVTYGDDAVMEHCMFDRRTSSCLDMINEVADYQYVDLAVPYRNRNDDVIFETLQATYGISQSCKNKELAWEFIKFCIGELEPPESLDENSEDYRNYMLWYQGNIPINKANFYHLYRYQVLVDLKKLEGGIKLKDGDTNEILTTALERMNEQNMQCNRLSCDFDLYTLLIDDLANFYYGDGLSSAEETAAIIQDKVTAYLNE